MNFNQRNTVMTNPMDMLIHGNRTLIGLLPSQFVMKPIADFVFGETKVTEFTYDQLIQCPGLLASEKNSVTGLQVSLDLTLVSIIFDSIRSLTIRGDRLSSNYTHGFLKSVVFTTIATSPTSRKSGMWAIGLSPFVPVEKESKSYRQITEMPFSKFGLVTQPLTLKFVPTPRHTQSYGMMGLNSTCLRLYVAYMDPKLGAAYGPSDFGCNIQMSGAILLACPKAKPTMYTREIDYNCGTLMHTVDGKIYTMYAKAPDLDRTI